ncbi:hypothetical protein [Dethiosulfovibrio salsuginis]|uniref:Uncharacterized protein n=1 Tax=Dethiosulfovibrio salsuginis TaxID=561720 RepID=A0A1X7K6T4_9BACT|nr:hypothetical protein [Dethiosulfovibrio salsuginis]SMG36077.1 hypothetical protein SAMN06275492_12112 [Dethiosulfovibrio salsuginis]
MKSKKSFALFSFSTILFFAIFFVVITGYRGDLGSFRLDEAVVCIDVDDSAIPWGVGNRFEFGVRQLCVLLGYSGGDDDMVRFSWFFRGQLVHEEIQILDDESNYRMFYILREDGSPLPVGSYSVQIDVNERKARKMAFSVEPSDESKANSQ